MNEERPINSDAKTLAYRIALGMYAGEPCRICGEPITTSDIHDAVYAGYSADNKARVAHKACWDKHLPIREWRHQ